MSAAVRAWAPGRTEIAGNHTDHQGGRVLAAAIDQGVTMRVEAREGQRAFVESEGFAPFEVDLSDTSPRPREAHTSAGLVRGVAAGLRAAGVPVRGFAAHVESTLPAGGGLSSSAAFELALACALDALFGGGGLPPLELARVGVAAERTWFGKPCGWQDQMASAHGGLVALDFSDPDRPTADFVDFDFESAGLAVCLVDAGCDHSAHTDDFARIVADMGAAAAFFGCKTLGQVDEGRFFASLPALRAAVGDLPALRAFHYFHEMCLVRQREAALRAGDVAAFLRATQASGASSAQFLQNVSVPGGADQPAAWALAATSRALAGRGAYRIHGGGFGGSVQAFVPVALADEFAGRMDALLRPGCVTRVRPGARGAFAQREGAR